MKKSKNLKPPPDSKPVNVARIDPLRINYEKVVADLLLADANKAMASLFTDIRKLRRLIGAAIAGSPFAQKKILTILDDMERKLAP